LISLSFILSVIIRLEKVTTYEAQLAAGKTLNNEKLSVLNSKKSLEMKSQLEEAAKVSSSLIQILLVFDVSLINRSLDRS